MSCCVVCGVGGGIPQQVGLVGTRTNMIRSSGIPGIYFLFVRIYEFFFFFSFLGVHAYFTM